MPIQYIRCGRTVLPSSVEVTLNGAAAVLADGRVASAATQAKPSSGLRRDIPSPFGLLRTAGRSRTRLARTWNPPRRRGYIDGWSSVCSARSRSCATGSARARRPEAAEPARDSASAPEQAVSRDRLIDGLWGERAPPTAGETLDTYVYRLRKLRRAATGIVRRPGGYSLRVERGELDLERFDELLAAAGDAAHDPALAAARLREAFALWRGPALADLRYEPFAGGEVAAARGAAAPGARTADRRRARRPGSGGELVPELEQLVGEHPTASGSSGS